MPDKLAPHLARGVRTRKRILDETVRIACVEGLEAITIGRVADATRLSKAGLLGHFPSKSELQLATLASGRDQFYATVVNPALAVPEGIARVLAIVQGWMDYVRQGEGGCFFASVAAEFDCRTGPVRDQVAAFTGGALRDLAGAIRKARQLGHFLPTADPDRLVFDLHGAILALNFRLHLLGDRHAPRLARESVMRVLAEAATREGRRFLEAR